MSSIKTERPDLQVLPRIKERISFLYLEKCIINRSENAISIKDGNGVTCMPAAMISALILGPGKRYPIVLWSCWAVQAQV